MFPGETVLSGAPDPGTPMRVLCSAAGWYVGYTDPLGYPYSRETQYLPSRPAAERALQLIEEALRDGPAALAELPFIRS